MSRSPVTGFCYVVKVDKFIGRLNYRLKYSGYFCRTLCVVEDGAVNANSWSLKIDASLIASTFSNCSCMRPVSWSVSCFFTLIGIFEATFWWSTSKFLVFAVGRSAAIPQSFTSRCIIQITFISCPTIIFESFPNNLHVIYFLTSVFDFKEKSAPYFNVIFNSDHFCGQALENMFAISLHEPSKFG